MRTLSGLTRSEEIARRIDLAVDEAYQGAKQEIHFDVTLIHHCRSIELPVRMVTEKEFAQAEAFCDAIANEEEPDPRLGLERIWNRQTVERYKRQSTDPYYTMELHTIRLGDVAICTNPFELYTEYGVRIKARSKALQTFVVQLACAYGAYLATEEALRGGGYSTAVYSNIVGPQGGNILVDRTVEAINAMWLDNSDP